jgi:Tfp pilus assembly protein PilV
MISYGVCGIDVLPRSRRGNFNLLEVFVPFLLMAITVIGLSI